MAARRYFSSSPVATGTVVVTTNPPGAQVVIDGTAQGVSPTTLTVAPGKHVLELRGAGEPRTMSLDVAAGAQLSQDIEMGKGPVTNGSSAGSHRAGRRQDQRRWRADWPIAGDGARPDTG